MAKRILDINEQADQRAIKRDKKRSKTFGSDNRTGIRLIAKLGSKSRKNGKK